MAHYFIFYLKSHTSSIPEGFHLNFHKSHNCDKSKIYNIIMSEMVLGHNPPGHVPPGHIPEQMSVAQTFETEKKERSSTWL